MSRFSLEVHSMGYKIQCPACGGHNYYIPDHNSMAYCFNCGHCERGNIGQQTAKVRSPHIDDIRHFYNRMADYYHAQLEGEALQYVYARGYSDDTIQKLKIGYIPAEQSLLYRDKIAQEAGLATYDGKAFLEHRISFPYISANGVITDIRGRDIGNDELKYKSPYGSAYYRGADYPYNYCVYKAPRILITEGEIKAGIALQYGYTIMALPGMGSWRHGWKPIEGQEIIIVFDRQDDDRHNIARAINKIIHYIPTVRIATLPHMGQRKMDIDTLLLNYDKRLFDIALQAALPHDKWLQFQR
jgi:DNA primase